MRTLLAVVLVLAGTVIPADTPPPRSPLAWHDCHTDSTPARLECATVTVPLDWSRPTGQKIDLAVDRLPATDPAKRIGVLLTNPGGPGGSGVQDVATEGAGPGPEFDILHERFDVIGFDPRGVGSSTPIRCPVPLRSASVSSFPTKESGYRQLLDANRRAGTECARRTGPLIHHVDTVSAARDIEAIRIALGEKTVSLLGGSYGTELFSAYIALHPRQVRAAVLDGAVDHTRSTWQAAQDEAAATEDAFHRFAAWCAHRPSCALRGRDVAADFAALAARADRGAFIGPDGQKVDGAVITKAMYLRLYRRAEWPELARLLAKATAARPDIGPLTDVVLSGDPEEAANITVGCHDFPSEVKSLPDLRAKADRLRILAPLTWRYSEMWTWATTCLNWPVPAANPPAPQYVHGSPPVLVANGTHDPATPLSWARSLTAQFDHARLFVYDGDGHTVTPHSGYGRQKEAEHLVNAT
ncbi:alpha/beta fold hydrolase [Streptomyces sp. CT34]|uniref:alpha/beta fold hydrolase n=1 Tax=Streptomyces sp. CT34 TaxID=1553907 RepID=UPI0005B99A9B|nr:alpha/beta fold hydrolase [Streptomyces sp. CT34]